MTGDEGHRAADRRRRSGGGIRGGPAISDETLSRRRHDEFATRKSPGCVPYPMNRQSATVKRLEVGVAIDIKLQLTLHFV